jgi:hypothetical protein
MVNGYVSASSVTYASDNNSVRNIPYKSYDQSLIFPGSRRIKILTNTNKLLADEIYAFNDSTYYTSFVYGWEEEPQHLITEDQLLSNLNEQIGLRFLHLSPSEGKINIYLDEKDTPLYGNREYEGENATDDENDHIVFKPHSRGKHTIIVTDENDDTLFEREYTFETGIHYSLILIGDSNSTNTPLYLGVVPQYR